MQGSSIECEAAAPAEDEIGRRLAERLRRELEEDPAGNDSCSIPFIHTNYIEKARVKLPEAALTLKLAGLFKVFADPTRIRLLSVLSASELCVCDLSAVLGMTQSAISHQLALLRSERLVKSRREGKIVWYSLDDEHVAALIAAGLEHVGESGRQG